MSTPGTFDMYSMGTEYYRITLGDSYSKPNKLLRDAWTALPPPERHATRAQELTDWCGWMSQQDYLGRSPNIEQNPDLDTPATEWRLEILRAYDFIFEPVAQHVGLAFGIQGHTYSHRFAHNYLTINHSAPGREQINTIRYPWEVLLFPAWIDKNVILKIYSVTYQNWNLGISRILDYSSDQMNNVLIVKSGCQFRVRVASDNGAQRRTSGIAAVFAVAVLCTKDHEANGGTNGHANGHFNGTNGHANGDSNGHANGHSNGHANRHFSGHFNDGSLGSVYYNIHPSGYTNARDIGHTTRHTDGRADRHTDGHVYGPVELCLNKSEFRHWADLANGNANEHPKDNLTGYANGNATGCENGNATEHADEHANGHANTDPSLIPLMEQINLG